MIGTERECLLFFAEPIFQSPDLSAIRANNKVQTLRIAEFILRFALQKFANCYVCKHRYPHVSNDTPITISVHGLFSSLMDTNQMNEKGRNGCPWSITVINGGGIVGGESGIRTHGTLLTYTRFPSVRLKPLGHLSCRARWCLRKVCLKINPLCGLFRRIVQLICEIFHLRGFQHPKTHPQRALNWH